LATAALLNKKKCSIPAIQLLDASVMINNQLVTYGHKKIFRDIYQSMDLREYFLHTYNWSNKTVDSIWWGAHGTILKSLGNDKRRFVHKFIHNKLPCNYRQNKYYKYKPDKCKLCNDQIETQNHIFWCKECPKRQILKYKYLKDIENTMDKHRINISTKMVIVHNIKNWLTEENYITSIDIAPDASNTLQNATDEQLTLGWDNWLKC
jgi:hypothetical protein